MLLLDTTAIDLLLIATLGFLGSFGHCAGMCGPLTVAFSLSQQHSETPNWRSHLGFHLLINLGRVISYGLVGAALGGVSEILIDRSQLLGIGSELRQGVTIVTGTILIWFALGQIKPDFLPPLPILHPLQALHRRLNTAMLRLSVSERWWTPALLGLLWGLIPCGFLYAAQIKAVERQELWLGAATMLAFGLGTMPMMVAIGALTSRLSASKRSQLFRLGGWVTLAIGILTLLRTDEMVDLTGHAALLLLMLALIARPLSGFWAAPLQYRRAIGVGAYVLAIAHTGRMLDHSFNWNLGAISYLLPIHRVGMVTGAIALLLITPAACTSFDYWQKMLGKRWRQIHLLCVPALGLAVIHTLLLGSHYLGELNWDWGDRWRSVGLVAIAGGVLLLRWRLFWLLFSLDKFYIRPNKH
ncbi:sulfite exporter TauE/SafE family protein [Hydrococcus rivularis]|uniref:urease accessory protein UreH domain-containing protein n=1 Tax=Hydrococcus rivularis TaxID=1616834 RepID=UPI0009F9C82B|nr:sulfite exporter TauE/SafE family protein [Hydrococcus rivularis]